ncbi:MAG TPA: hypothetical protein VIL97_00765, partial [Thermoanaerobaculia bacterium]
MSNPRILILATIALALSATAHAGLAPQPMKTLQEKYTNSVPLDATGVVRISNTNGTVTVIGTNSPGLEVEAVKIIRGIDDRAIREGKLQTEIEVLGNAQVRTI